MRAQEFLTEMDRRGFLKGLAGFAASAAVPSSVVKLLSTPAGVGSLATPAGVSTLGIQAGLALLKGIRKHLDQYRAEDDDDYFEAYEDMAARLGFEATNADGEYHDPLSDLLNLYRKNPEQSAQQLIKHVQSKAVDPANIKASFRSRVDNPSDWRYHALKDREEPELTGGYGDKPAASAKPSVSNVSNVATAPGTLARAAVAAKAGIDKLSNLKKPALQAKPAPALSAPARPKVELPVNVKQKIKQGEQLTEFDPGEGGFGPFKVYYEQDYFIGQFPTYEEAKGEVDFLRDTDPKSATHHWRIVDGTGETVWEYDIGDDVDAWRRSQKFQKRPQ
jgi:hypothetical protein